MTESPGRRASFAGVELYEADFSGAVLRESDVRGLRILASVVDDLEVTAFAGRLGSVSVEGVDVTPFVLAELDRRHPDRALVRDAHTADELRAAWVLVDAMWAALVTRAAALPEAARRERVGGEWSVTETLRHLVFAVDIWVGRMLAGEAHPWHPIGRPTGDCPAESVAEMGVDADSDAPWDEVVAVWESRRARAAARFATVTDADLDVEVTRAPSPDIGDETHSVRECLRVVVHELSEHHRYAARDLDVVEAGLAPGR